MAAEEQADAVKAVPRVPAMEAEGDPGQTGGGLCQCQAVHAAGEG